MNVLLSIKPEYVGAILSRTKKYEFRRTIFKRKDVEKVYLYSNSSVQKIVGSFEIEKILEGTPQTIWKMCNKYGGISKKDFFKYFEGVKKAFGIKIKNVHEFCEPIDPRSVIDNFIFPQSFYYVDINIPFDKELI